MVDVQSVKEKSSVSAGEQTSKKNRGPVDQWTLKGVQISEWKNRGKDGGEFSSFSVGKRYFDANAGVWKTGNSFSASDLVNLSLLSTLASQTLVKRRQAFVGDAPSGRLPENIEGRPLGIE